jgi:phosphatidate cytidylyltransferase
MDRRDLLRRALVVFTLGPLTLLFIYLGSWFYFLAFGALLTIATIEYAHLMRKLGWHAPLTLIIPFSVALWFLPEPVQTLLLGSVISDLDLVSPLLLVSLFAALIFALWLYERRPDEDAPGSWMAMIGAIILMGWLGSHFFRLRGLPENAAQWTALAMLGTWIADSGAYVFGKTLGKHKLAPRLSPNKTIEGYVGGILVGTLFTVLIGLLFGLPLSLVFILGLLVSIVSPAGDLGVSLLKRSAGVKDSGNLLPGHGGALDRIDTLLWSVALAYYLVIFAG